MALGILESTNLTTLNLTLSCSSPSIYLGQQISDYFAGVSFEPIDDNGTYGPLGKNLFPGLSNSGPDGYEDWWPDGPPSTWVDFWRTVLTSSLPPNAAQNLTDTQIAVWANSSVYFGFFEENYYDSGTSINSTNLGSLAFDISENGGCKQNLNNQDRISKSQRSFFFTQMVEDCIVSQCCSPAPNSPLLTSGSKIFLNVNWTYHDACGFIVCDNANHGNPDLGGIGIVVAYYIEASLLAITWALIVVEVLVKMISTSRRSRTRSGHYKMADLWKRHTSAFLDSTMMFLDNASYFSISISFASILFNYRNQPLLYEDKLGQTSSLLAIDAPLTIILLTYTRIKERNLRYALVGAAALMTFIIQFMFRRAGAFQSADNGCLDWKESMESSFSKLFVIKAVWAGLVLVFFLTHSTAWLLPQIPKMPWYWPLSKLHRKIVTSKTGRLLQPLSSAIYRHIREITAIVLAAYGVFDSFFDISFIGMLRKEESKIATASQEQDEEDIWGYGQILAVLIWLPIIVEYFYKAASAAESKEESGPGCNTNDAAQKSRDGDEKLHTNIHSVGYSPHQVQD